MPDLPIYTDVKHFSTDGLIYYINTILKEIL